MLIDITRHFFRKDNTVKRDLVKTISWRIIGSVDTALLGLIITGKLSVGLKIGALELLTKMVLYFFHERAWHRISYGLPPQLLLKKNMPSDKRQLFAQSFAITREEREKNNGHSAFTIWLTGLPGSGKSTLASELEQWMHRNELHTYIMDGDNTRLGINSDLDFSEHGREENLRRVAEICKLMNDAGVIVIASFISPLYVNRSMVKDIIGKDSFTEVFVDAAVTTCKQRDKKGLYKLAAEGKIKNFTGVNAPYEKPAHPSVYICTDEESIEESAARLIKWVSQNILTANYAQPATTEKSVWQ